ncbi:hypothetical protein FOB58_004957 [Candida parapsilosis]|uniref:UPF3 domain-containing protein n=1 Tax=Candida parapsilosis TaxID=5480 RepID=A0A8X7T9U5_CANPA|nr:hypothetical protein FOB58_004957 [Candida parapsilosis]KAF6044939.1 hypothetical protein FOB59_004416 [Candida parapsilosis]KAF6048914.1 hypothetical protein FOB60_004297 [Candida parapsilosis]KAF6060914.1 hypothetical protein FOB61_004922 [Candida parapsilosis]KAI5905850.1 hypothetical protein K4G60_g5121 [Candida parapsilosis]
MTSIAPSRAPETAISSAAPKRNNRTNHNLEGTSTTKLSSKRTSQDELEQNVKLSLRLLPPGLKEDEFLNQLANIYPHHASKIQLHYFVQGSYPSTPFEVPVYSRAYVTFKNAKDSSEFCSFVKNKPFHDEKDSIIPIVEKAVFPKMITSDYIVDSKREPQKDKKLDNLEDDEIYKKFLLYLDKGVNEFDLKKIHKALNKKSKEKPKKNQSASVSKSSKRKKVSKEEKEKKEKKEKKENKEKKDKDLQKGKEKGKGKGKEKGKEKKAKEKKMQDGKAKEKENVKGVDNGIEKGKENQEQKKKNRNRKPQAHEPGSKVATVASNGKDNNKSNETTPASKSENNKNEVSGVSKSRRRHRNRKKRGEKKEGDTPKGENNASTTPIDFKPIKILTKKDLSEN